MGMAASQSRYLALTARKSNVEYTAQQINQQRTTIANELSGTFADLVELKVPTVPSELDYQATQYKFTEPTTNNMYNFINSSQRADGHYDVTLNLLNADGSISYTGTVVGDLTQNTSSKKFQYFDILSASSDPTQMTNLGFDPNSDYSESLSYQTVTDEEAYQQAYNEYVQKKAVYDKRVNEINNKTVELQKKDSNLELRLRQLDTEQNSIQTELESVKKVIEDTVERVFSTFKSS